MCRKQFFHRSQQIWNYVESNRACHQWNRLIFHRLRAKNFNFIIRTLRVGSWKSISIGIDFLFFFEKKNISLSFRCCWCLTLMTWILSIGISWKKNYTQFLKHNYMFLFFSLKRRCEVKSRLFTKLSVHFKIILFEKKSRKYDHDSVRKRTCRDMLFDWFMQIQRYFMSYQFDENVSHEVNKICN